MQEDIDLTPEELCFNLFVDSVKQRDKMQFSYFDLYYNIAHGEELTNTKSEEEEFTL